MILKLVLVSQAKCDSTELFLGEGSYGIGRHPDNELRIQEYCVSGYHAEVSRTPDGVYEIRDLDSSNGTFLNRKRISSPTEIKPGDFLKFGIIKVAVEEHEAESPCPKGDVNTASPPLKVFSLKDRFSRAKHHQEETAQVSAENVAPIESREPATPRSSASEAELRGMDNAEEDGIVLFGEEFAIEEPHHDLRGAWEQLTASRDAAEAEARRLREELSRVREELSERNTETKRRLSFHITELESSLMAEKLLNDNVKAKNEQFRSRIQFLTLDLGNAQEEVSRLKAINARQFSLPDDLSEEGAGFAKLKEELAISHDDNADLQARITELKGELAKREFELAEREQDEARVEGNQIAELQQEIDELRARLSESESLSESAVDEKTVLTKSQEDLQRRLETAEEAVQKSIESEVTLRRNNAKLIDKLKEAEGRISDLRARIEEGSSSDSRNLQRIKVLEMRLKDFESLSEARRNIEDELESTRQRQNAAEAEVEQLKKKLASMEAEARQVREQLAASEAQCSDIDVLLSAKSNLAAEQAALISQLRKELTETTRGVVASERELVETHREEMEALKIELRTSRDESDKLNEEIESLRSDLASLQDKHAKRQTRQSLNQEAKLAKLEEDLAQSIQLRDEIESARDELMVELSERNDQLSERDERIAALMESSEELRSRIAEAEEEKLHLASSLRLTREGLSAALHSIRARLVEMTEELESEILRRDKVEKQLRKADLALEELRDEIETLRAEADEGVILSPEDTNLNRISDPIEEKSEELLAFEARLEALRPSHGNGSEGKRDFSEEEFYRQLVEKLDLIDDLIKCYENKWRYRKVVEQLDLLKHAFLELLEDQSVSLIDLKPGTPLCLNQSHRLDLVPLEDGTQPKIDPFGKSEVVETVCPGYIFHAGSRDVIIRKARVVVS